MQSNDWRAVDNYVEELFSLNDPALEAALEASRAAGLPDISVSPAQGRWLQVLARAQGARRILEIGTLGGFSAICLARALPPDGRLITLEVDPSHADAARGNIARAGLADVASVIVGPALETLPTVTGPFDFIFIDADKPSYTAYLSWALRLSRPGTLIVADNVVRQGAIINADSEDPRVQGMRRFLQALAEEPRVTATVLQTVGSKSYDGFALAVVIAGATT
jgi:predicted O-methyltransferase YrrM